MQGHAEAPIGPPTKLGVILVHGIGEQRRFEHLDGQLRFLIRALHGLKLGTDPVQDVSVDIQPGTAAAFHAEADSWNAGPEAAVMIVVRRRVDNVVHETQLHVHEVWWADVNETYSLAKQLRFWLWGLAVWMRPGKAGSHYANKAKTANQAVPDQVPEATAQKIDATPPGKHGRHVAWDRVRLFGVGVYFALLGYSIGTLSFLANRLLNLKTPKLLQLLTNYVSGVKIYNQRHRFAPGLSWQSEEFLDSVGEPPRVSIRRRMIRAIADVACNAEYERWYILAHSLGTVVAFNGIMETAYSWPGYLDEGRWQTIKAQDDAGRQNENPKRWLETLEGPLPGGPTMPRRPAWLDHDIAVNRKTIFEKFAGLLTYGSPLEKFAALWPALVTMSNEPGVFADTVRWINVYDTLDPVSGRLTAFTPAANAGRVPRVQNLGYNAGWVLLLAHSQYLKRRHDGADLATAVVNWMLTNTTAPFDAMPPGGVHLGQRFTPLGVNEKEKGHRLRSAIAWGWWLVTAAALSLAGGYVLPMLLRAARAALTEITKPAASLFAPLTPLFASIGDAVCWTGVCADDFLQRSALLLVFAAILTTVIGIGARAFVFRRDDDDPQKSKHLDDATARRRRHGI